MINYWLQPDWEPLKSITSIPIKHFHSKGINAILLDVDGTILPGKETLVNEKVIKWINIAKQSLYLHLFSNNPSKSRISRVANQLELDYTFRASKPRKKKLLKVLNDKNLTSSKSAIVGDRIFTDIWVGNRIGIYTVLVKPIGHNGNESLKANTQNIEKFISKSIGAYSK